LWLSVVALSMKDTTEKPEFIGGRMRQAREALLMSQQQLADAIGGSKRGIQDNEARNRVPGGEVIFGLVKLGINANWLLTGDGDMWLPSISPQAAQPTAQPYGAISPAVDSVLLQKVIDLFFGWLDANGASVRIDAALHGTVIAVLYSVCKASGKCTEEELQQVLRLAA